MKIKQFEYLMHTLFPKELLEEFHDDYGFVYIADSKGISQMMRARPYRRGIVRK